MFVIYRHAQVLSSLQAWCHWISLWAHGDGPKEPVNSLVGTLVASAVDVFSPTWSSMGVTKGSVKENGCEKVYQAGLQLLSSVVSVIRTSNLWNCPSWNEVYHSVYDIDYLPAPVCLPFNFFILQNCLSEIVFARFIGS